MANGVRRFAIQDDGRCCRPILATLGEWLQGDATTRLRSSVVPHLARFEGRRSDSAGRPRALRWEQEKKRGGGLANSEPPAQGPALTVPGVDASARVLEGEKSIRVGSVDRDRSVGVAEGT